MSMTWLPGAKVHDLHPGIGNGPFDSCWGVILHVNVDEHGTPDSFWGNGNPGQVCPNFQVYKDGSIHQMLPLNWQPWCQVDGNYHYAAIETAGLPSEPLTDAQLAACGRIMAAYHHELGVPLQLANSPGQRGLGTHSMGGAAWGGHSCPGSIRANQRAQILTLAGGHTTSGTGTPLEDDVTPEEHNWLQNIYLATNNIGGPSMPGGLSAATARAVWGTKWLGNDGKSEYPASTWLVNANKYAAQAMLATKAPEIEAAIKAAIPPGTSGVDVQAIAKAVLDAIAAKLTTQEDQ